MKNTIIIHGTGGDPGENWFPWMKKQLEVEGCAVHVPAFPTCAMLWNLTWWLNYQAVRL